jgi:hypothetical protein
MTGPEISRHHPPRAGTRRFAAKAIFVCCASVVLSLQAGELRVGDAMPPFSARDQFGKDFKFAAGLHFFLLGFDMSTGKAANLKLAELGPGWLEKHGAVYVLDIHTMPGIARVFALPKMRKYPHRIMLAETEGLLAPFPRQPDQITVLVLTTDGKIKEIRYWNPVKEALSARLN